MIKKILKLFSILIFLYIAFFSIKNFNQGYHDIDTAFNFMHLDMLGDYNADGVYVTLEETYIRGINRIHNSIDWLCIDCILGVLIGWLFRGANK